MKHCKEATIAPPVFLSSYVLKVKTSFTLAVWESICQHPDVRLAYDALIVQPLRVQKYAYVSFLLNAISLAHVEIIFPNAADDRDVVFYESPHLHVTRGDYLGTDSNPDWVGYLQSLRKLRLAVASAKATLAKGQPLVANSKALPQGWPRLVDVGEGKPEDANESDKGQFLSYLRALKAYRPDLRIVHGFQLDDTRLRLASQNACSTTDSDYIERPDDDADVQLQGWVAHVALVYRSVAERDTTITHRLPEDDIVRYDLSIEGRNVCVIPAYASRPPGRLTWVGFEIGGESPTELGSACNEVCAGVVKISYQNNAGRFKEGELLDRAHKDGWLPGVVRHTSWKRDPTATVNDMTKPEDAEDQIFRVKETLHLASVGDPLSQCTTPLHMLKVAYDATETHLQLTKKEILHRDLSWYNILCNPYHHPSTLEKKKVQTGIPCIDYILTGDRRKEPCCLITDFDHGGHYPEIHAIGYIGRPERTATPMFSAVEMSTDDPLTRLPATFYLEDVIPKFREAEKLPVFGRAFPAGNGGFVEMVETIVRLEIERRKLIKECKAPGDRFKLLCTNPKTIVHDPCYDVQSIYWSLLWFFLRALPKGEPAEDDLDGHFSTFANGLIEHKVGKDKFRCNNFFEWEGPVQELHPDLQHFAPLFQSLAAYLAVPWHMYKNHPEVRVPDNHAHTAMRLLLLAEIYVLSTNDQLNIPLDPTQPRIINTSAALLTDRRKEISTRDSTTTTTNKRKANAAGLVDDSDVKRRKHAGSALVSPRDVPDPKDATPGRAKPPHKCYKSGCEVESAAARSEKLRDDRFLFFGVGRRKA